MSLVSLLNTKIIFVLSLLIVIKPSLGRINVFQGSGPGFSFGSGAQGSGRGFSFGSGSGAQGSRQGFSFGSSGEQGSGQGFSFGSGGQGSGPGFSGMGFSSGVNNGVPFFWSFNGPEADKCLATLRNTPGCVQEIFGSLFKFPFQFIGPQFHSIGPQCCKVVMDIEDNCWPKIFPISPLFPLTLKNLCNTQGQGQGQAPVAAQQQLSPPSPPQPSSNSDPLPLTSTSTSTPSPPKPYAYSFSFGDKGNSNMHGTIGE